MTDGLVLTSVGAADALPMTVAATAATTHMRVACIMNPLEFLNSICLLPRCAGPLLRLSLIRLLSLAGLYEHNAKHPTV
jgi:hypothetical protein